ncbi:V-type K+-independent H+-translocating inorganic pyrophosphatase [Cardiosporidium cionae]|uniref:H(+)-exporting diphosphatase n=1 Tax=Cardiosporidium cionae TaxID=476202 RepID=A0ABQ7J4I2_9APIC|nr:V-type K+-independent H+-translocating inorganic pyrophosphatase [Cardiosporidium cionae]|eukprot:KAF8817985.1 V-type K+-independent H+-translocating inorganic pyrophosphatase [Cardiosporidium cionae]
MIPKAYPRTSPSSGDFHLGVPSTAIEVETTGNYTKKRSVYPAFVTPEMMSTATSPLNRELSTSLPTGSALMSLGKGDSGSSIVLKNGMNASKVAEIPAKVEEGYRKGSPNFYSKTSKGRGLSPISLLSYNSEGNSPLSMRRWGWSSMLERCVDRFNRKSTAWQRLVICSVLLIAFTLNLIFLGLDIAVSLKLILISLTVSFTGLLVAGWLLTWIFCFDEGTASMQAVSDPIREGSEGFFSVQYNCIIKISLFFAFLIVLLYFYRGNMTILEPEESTLSTPTLATSTVAFITAFCFLMGAFCSALTGYSGMWVSVRTNVRVASAACRCYNEALQLCFRGGAFSSIINVSLAIGGIASILLILSVFFPWVPFTQLPMLVVGYGFGASLVAMFAQLGGGIYTKGADVGADLVGKIELEIPEDDPRNPAVIADLVGDNVGDCAGQCADLFESIAAEIIATMILGGALANEARLSANSSHGYVLFPLGVHCMDLFISSVGILLVRTKKGLPDADSAMGGREDPMKIMKRIYLYTCVAGCIGIAILCRVLLHVPEHPIAWKLFAICGTIGMICAFLFVLITQYYTDYEYSQVRRIAEASLTGPATNIIAGLSVGFESTALPVLCICIALVSSYYLGVATNLCEEHPSVAGLFGTAVATMGMLCTAVFVLSMSSFGPIADNAGGIVEMSQQSEQVRAITDRLDAVGNVTKANTKGFSVGSAALASFLLFSAFLDEVSLYTKERFSSVDITKPEIFVSGLIGSMMVFVFASWSMAAVGRAAQSVVKEVRRQFSEHPGILIYREKPDYHTCVAIVSRAALKEMIKPGLLSILSPIAVGCFFRMLASFTHNVLLGAEAVAAFLMFSTATGILLALLLNNGGGSWDNAKKYIETGAYGGKKSDAHKAAVVGDTVGDPCKDTVGPSLHVLIKLVSTVTLVCRRCQEGMEVGPVEGKRDSASEKDVTASLEVMAPLFISMEPVSPPD